MYTKDLLYSNNYNVKNEDNIEKIIDIKKTNIKKNIPKNNYKVINYNDLLNSNSIDSNPNSYNNINQKLDNNLNNLDSLFNDINELESKKYKKNKKTKISINSEDRNLEKYIFPNNFYIDLNKTYKNIEKIVLKDIYFPNSIPILNNFNNRFTWEYPILNDIDDIYIPDPLSNLTYSTKISYELGLLLPDTTSRLIYSTKLNIKYATTKQFEKEFSYQLSNNLHHIKNHYDLDCIEETNNERDYKEFTKNSLPVTSIDIEERPILFDIDINPINHVVKLVNRIEKFQIYSYQIFSTDNTTNDIFHQYSTSKKQLYKNRIYITIKSTDYNNISFSNKNSTKLLPLVITNMKDIGNISNNIINYTPFYNINIYGYTPDNISTYKFFDNLEFTDICGNTNSLVRLELTLSSGNINGLYYNISGKIIKTNCTKNIITNNWLNNFLSNLDKNSLSIDYFLNNETDELPLIGRAMPIRLIKKVQENNKDIIESVLDILGWPNEYKSNNIQNASLKHNYYYIQSNIDSFQKNIFTNLIINDSNINMIFNYLSPQKKLNLELINNNYYFKSIPFIFIKIVPHIETKVIQNQLVRCFSKLNNINNIEYSKDFYEKIINDNIEYYKPNSENILAKIYLEPGPLKTTILNDISIEYISYNKPIENLEKIKIIITDPYGRILNIENNFSFTIEIHETLNVLNNTLLDTRRGDIVKTGLKN